LARLGLRLSQRSPEKARHENSSQPAKAGFFLGELLFLSRSPPLFDELHYQLAAIAQAMAFLERVNEGDRFAPVGGISVCIEFGHFDPALS